MLDKDIMKIIGKSMTPDEIVTYAQEKGISLTKEHAKEISDQLTKTGELSDDDLDTAVGGCGGGGAAAPGTPYCMFCGDPTVLHSEGVVNAWIGDPGSNYPERKAMTTELYICPKHRDFLYYYYGTQAMVPPKSVKFKTVYRKDLYDPATENPEFMFKF